MKKQLYANLTEGLDDIEDVTNDHEKIKQPDMIEYLKHLSKHLSKPFITKSRCVMTDC